MQAFLDAGVRSEGTDNGRVRKPEIMVMTLWSVGGELFIDYSDHPRKLVTLNPKINWYKRRTLPASFPLVDAYRKQLGLKDFSPKSQDAVALQQALLSVALYP